jgi:hypothetical protein
MTVAAPAQNYENIQGAGKTVGFSEESEMLRASLEEALNHYLGPNVLGEPLRSAFENLDEIMETCSHENWDSYGAKIISDSAYREAKIFIQLLPITFPQPNISPEPSGGITLEWYKNPNHVFFVILSGTGVITYAGLYGVDNQDGGTVYFGDSIPTSIIDRIRSIFWI